MYLYSRKIHMYIGLIFAIFILIEALTGLLLAEPGIVGQGAPPAEFQQGGHHPPAGSFGLAKNFHKGIVGNMKVTWLVDLTAISLVLLTLTGVHMSISTLRTKVKKPKESPEE